MMQPFLLFRNSFSRNDRHPFPVVCSTPLSCFRDLDLARVPLRHLPTRFPRRARRRARRRLRASPTPPRKRAFPRRQSSKSHLFHSARASRRHLGRARSPRPRTRVSAHTRHAAYAHQARDRDRRIRTCVGTEGGERGTTCGRRGGNGLVNAFWGRTRVVPKKCDERTSAPRYRGRANTSWTRDIPFEPLLPPAPRSREPRP